MALQVRSGLKGSEKSTAGSGFVSEASIGVSTDGSNGSGSNISIRSRRERKKTYGRTYEKTYVRNGRCDSGFASIESLERKATNGEDRFGFTGKDRMRTRSRHHRIRDLGRSAYRIR